MRKKKECEGQMELDLVDRKDEKSSTGTNRKRVVKKEKDTDKETVSAAKRKKETSAWETEVPHTSVREAVVRCAPPGREKGGCIGQSKDFRSDSAYDHLRISVNFFFYHIIIFLLFQDECGKFL